jgi:hypothetical protein
VAGVGAGSYVYGSGTQSPVMVQGAEVTWGPNIPYAFEVTTQYTDGSSSSASAASNAVAYAGGAGPTTSPNVYVDGEFYWIGDYHFGGTVTYTDTKGDPQADSAGPGPMDMAWTADGVKGGCFMPHAPTAAYDTTPYKYLQLDLKPTTANKTWLIYFELAGDVSIAAQAFAPSDSNGTYGPAPVVGEWATYKIPLKNLGVGPQTANTSIYKFGICDGSATTNTVFYVNNVKFLTE